MSSTDKQGSSLGSFPTSPPLYSHFNRPSGFWPCVKSCLVGGSDKYRQIKRRQTTPTDKKLQLWERERVSGGRVKLETMHHPHWLSSSPLWRKRLSRKSPNIPLLFALVTSDWPRACKSNNRTTVKHRAFLYLLIPYQHVYLNPVIWTIYLFVFKKIFTCLRVSCFCNCVFVLSLQPYADIEVRSEIQTVSFGNRTRVTVFLFYDINHYPADAFIFPYLC